MKWKWLVFPIDVEADRWGDLDFQKKKKCRYLIRNNAYWILLIFINFYTFIGFEQCALYGHCHIFIIWGENNWTITISTGTVDSIEFYANDGKRNLLFVSFETTKWIIIKNVQSYLMRVQRNHFNSSSLVVFFLLLFSLQIGWTKKKK